MPTNRGGHILVSENTEINEQGEGKITGTKSGSKFSQDVSVQGIINSNVTIDLTDKISNFKLYDIDNFQTISDITYVMYSDLSSKWFVKKVDQSSGFIRYASVVNNPAETFNSCWLNKASLSYGFRKDIVSGL